MYTAESYRLAASAEEAFLLLREDPKSAVLGGGLWMRTGSAGYTTLIDVSGLGLDGIEREDGAVTIGACATLRQIETSETLREAGMDFSANLILGSAALLSPAGASSACTSRTRP